MLVHVDHLDGAFISLDLAFGLVYFCVNRPEVSIDLFVIVLAHHYVAVILLGAHFDPEIGLEKLVIFDCQIQQIPLFLQGCIFQAVYLGGARNGQQFPFDTVIFLRQLIHHSLGVQGLDRPHRLLQLEVTLIAVHGAGPTLLPRLVQEIELALEST